MPKTAGWRGEAYIESDTSRRPVTRSRKGTTLKVTPGFKKSLETEVSETNDEVERLVEEIKNLEEEYKALEEQIATKKSAVSVLRDNLVILKGWLDQMD